jgi:CRISPR-associated protein Csm5
LRVGRHSGAESVTVSGARNGAIKIMKGRGQPPKYADAPKTLWLAADSKDQRTGLLPFGWLLVEVEPLEAPAQDWPELRALCEPHLQQAKALAAKLGREREKNAQLRAQAETRRGEEERQARAEADKRAEATRLEAEQAARLAALSENAKEAEELRAKCDNATKNKGKGSQLFGDAKKLIEQAAEWSGEDKAALKAVAAYVFDWLGVKKDEAKKLLRPLDAA